MLLKDYSCSFVKVTNLRFFVVAKAIIYIQLQSGLEKAASQEIKFVPFRNCVTSALSDCELLRSGHGTVFSSLSWAVEAFAPTVLLHP